VVIIGIGYDARRHTCIASVTNPAYISAHFFTTHAETYVIMGLGIILVIMNKSVDLVHEADSHRGEHIRPSFL